MVCSALQESLARREKIVSSRKDEPYTGGIILTDVNRYQYWYLVS